MTQIYPIQIIALDKTAHQAVDLAELNHFADVAKIEPKELANTAIKDHHQILVLSELTMPVLNEFDVELSEMEAPIVLMPHKDQESEEIKQLVLMGVRIIFAPSDTILSFSLSQMLKNLEMIFYGEHRESEIITDHKDVYEVLGNGTITEFYESDGHNISKVIATALNTPNGFSNAFGALILFEVTDAYPLVEIAEAMEFIEEVMPEESGILFETRHTHTKNDYVKVICVVSRYVDFKNGVQSQINQANTYLDKAGIIVDAAYEGTIDYEGVQLLAVRNNIAEKDLDNVYTLLYINPRETLKLMRLLRDESLPDQKKEEAVAITLIETTIDTDLLEELVIMHDLSVDNILAIKKRKEEGEENNEKTQDQESGRETV